MGVLLDAQRRLTRALAARSKLTRRRLSAQAGARPVRIVPAQVLVEAKLGVGKRLGHGQSELVKARSADRDEQRFYRLDAALEIVKPSLDEVLAGELSDHVRVVHSPTKDPKTVSFAFRGDADG